MSNQTEAERIAPCPAHGIPDCSPLLNGCSRPDLCHCGKPVHGPRDGIDLGPASRALCEDCLPVRCDAYPGACKP